MRAVFVLLLAVAAQSAAPPRNVTHVAFYNDSECSQHVRDIYEPNLPSPKCVPHPYDTRNVSIIFQCSTAHNLTSVRYTWYNHTEQCDHAPELTYASLAPAHSCAPMLQTYQGDTQIVYARIRCGVERGSSLDATAAVAHQLAALSSIAELIKSKRSHSTKLSLEQRPVTSWA